jgi:hypothetical protein
MTTFHLDPDEASYYASQSPFSDPGEFASLYDALPSDPSALARIARGLAVHRWEDGLFQITHLEDRLHNDAETRYVDDILRIITERNAAPLTEAREFGDRFVGICRDFCLLFCSMLRHAGIPARLRSGFADYFSDDELWHDHVVVEYWDAARGWIFADPQLTDPVATEAFAKDFDPLDVPRDRFLVASKAWRMVRDGAADPKCFGVHLEVDPLVGKWFIAAVDVRVDLADLNKTETLLWDVWGAVPEDDDAGMTEDICELYDKAAEVTGDVVPFADARRLFQTEERLRTPKTVQSLTLFHGQLEVTLR